MPPTSMRLALLLSLAAGASAQPSPGWRVVLDAGLAAGGDGAGSMLPYATAALSAERTGWRGLLVGARLSGGGSPLADVDCFEAIRCPDGVDGWGAAEATLAAEARSGGLAVRATVGAGLAYVVDRENRVAPSVRGGVGLDLHPVRAVGLGVWAGAAARAVVPTVEGGLGLRVRF